MNVKQRYKRNLIIQLCILAALILMRYLASVGILKSYYMQLFLFAEINVIMTVSLNLINGFTGQFSLGHAAFMGIGAYVSAVITSLLFHTAQWPPAMQMLIFFSATLIGGVCAGFIGFLIGLPTLKLKGDYLAIVTLAFGEVVKSVIRLIDYIGGPRGITNIPKFSNFYWITGFAIFSVFFIRNYVYSKYGRASISIRENEIAAQAMGISTTKNKIRAFVVAAFFAGIAGSLYGHLLMFIEPNLFDLSVSINYLVYMYAGGMASISGSIISTIVLTILPEALRFLQNWRYVIYPLMLVIIMLKRPNGLLGGRELAVLNKDRNEYLAPVGLRKWGMTKRRGGEEHGNS